MATFPYGTDALISNGAGLDTYSWKSGVFSPTQTCPYEVHVRWPAQQFGRGNLPFTVSGHTGGLTTLTFNQSTGWGTWVLHGTYTFASGAEGTVHVTDENGPAVADAVRFVLPAGGSSPVRADRGVKGKGRSKK